MGAELVSIDYDPLTQYFIEQMNAVGATTSTTLRTVTTHSDANCKYVKKWGTNYAIGNIITATIATPRSDGGGVNKWWYEFYNQSDTLLGTLKDENGGWTYVDGTAETSTRIYIKIVQKSGTISITNGDTLTCIADVGGQLIIYLSGESFTSGDLTLYVSYSGSTYYDLEMKYGGYRHTPTGVQRYPYFHPEAADAALGGAFTIVTVLDSETYEVEDYNISLANTVWQADLGQIPTLTNGVGARVTREVEHDGNNSDTIYVANSIGSDTTGDGTYQNPYASIQFAENNLSGRIYINIIDTNIYNEIITIDSAISIEPAYNYIPVIRASGSGIGDIIINNINANIYGMEIDGNNNFSGCININVNSYVGNIEDNNCYNAISAGIYSYAKTGYNGNIKNNRTFNSSNGIQFLACTNLAGIITKNYVYSNAGSGINLYVGSAGGANSIDVTHNMVYKNGGRGIFIYLIVSYSGSVENNTIGENTLSGLEFVWFTSMTGIIRNNIAYGNGDNVIHFDLHNPNVARAVTITESIYGTNKDFTIGAGCINADPIFCDKDNAPYKFGISSDSQAFRTDSNNDDMGVHFRMINFGANDIIINGFNIDGQEGYINGIIKISTTDYIGLKIKWCDIHCFQGIAIDIYDDDIDTDADILRCKIYKNGNGIKLAHGGNKITECIIYRNSIFGIWSDYMGQTFNHLVLFGNNYGIYLESNSGIVVLKNLISDKNSLYGIYSEVSVVVYNSCIIDATENVSILEVDGNITENPLFIDTQESNEDFHLKTIERGSLYLSPCLKKADDGYDMGAYLENRYIQDQSWQKFVLEYNPDNINELIRLKGARMQESALGSPYPSGKANKRTLPFVWNDDSAMSKLQWLKMKYFLDKIPSSENNLLREDCRFRIHLVPSAYILTGTGTVDASEETISGVTLIENEVKGFYVGIKFESLTNVTVDATNKKITKTGAGWDADEWNGYNILYNNFPLLILDTIGDDIFLSDPDGILIDGTYSTDIIFWFKVDRNTKNKIYLFDEYSKLISGSKDFFVDFVECIISSRQIQYRQPGYNYLKYEWKTGFSSTFEEI